jgi:transcriptional regulator with XRE-family HTH domain
MARPELPPPIPLWQAMEFARRLVALRHDQGLTQQALADRAELHPTLIRRYETGKVQPSIDALKRLALALSVSTDQLLFDEAERQVPDDLRLQLEATSRLTPEGRQIVRQVIRGLLASQEITRLANSA